ncbi:DUF2017 family protein [Streptoalloteichus hindustanus]|uniref:Uncharacterized protein n=1 Tax=Streptoalloteichus hindustanus TaxID=2017 RepID=A0A1M4XSJ3_STRHI|nr:DUF2017 family protein [Streptoalloteichus hindustanus]SHE96425.1 protein of unknown function [Streptoalloteichus hindustanus]
MGPEVHYAQDVDYLEAVAAPDGVVVRMSENVAVVVEHILERLTRFLADGEAPGPRRWFGLRRAPSTEDLLDRMFPDAYQDSASTAAFRARHRSAMRAEALAAAQRVRQRWAGQPLMYLERQDVDDWFVVAGLARFLFGGRRRSRDVMEVVWLNFLMDRLVAASHPSLSALAQLS